MKESSFCYQTSKPSSDTGKPYILSHRQRDESLCNHELPKLTGNLYLSRALTRAPTCSSGNPSHRSSVPFRSRPGKSRATLQDDQAPLKAKTAALEYILYQWRCRFVVSRAGQILTISDPTAIFLTSYVSLFPTPVPIHDPWYAGNRLQASPHLS